MAPAETGVPVFGGEMRSWSQAGFETICGERDDDVVWLAPRGVGTAKTAVGGRMGRIGLCMAGGIAVTVALPGVAVAPVAQARVTLENVLFPALPDIAVAVPAAASRPVASEATRETVREALESFLRFGNRDVPRPIADAIVRAATATGVDPIYLMALADKESAFQAQVKASTSSARGLYQFIDRTWLDVVRRFGTDYGLAVEAAAVYGEKEKPIVDDPDLRSRILELRNDPYLSAVMAAEMLKKDAEEIGLKLGRALNTTEMYLAHFLGIEDAARFLALREDVKPPVAATIFPAAARANVAIFYGPAVRTGGRKRGRWTRPSLTIPQVYDRIRGMIDVRLERFGPIKTYAVAGTDPS